MTFEEAQQKALTVKWKAVPCHVGKKCWCRMIVPKKKIAYKDSPGDAELWIIGSAAVSKEHAEHIVRLHNNFIERGNHE